MDELRIKVNKILKFKDGNEKKKKIREIISEAIRFSKEVQDEGDLFESGEFLYSAAEIVEYVDPDSALKLYKQNIKVWEKQIDQFMLQAKIHEIAEIYLKIAEIYRKKFKDFKLEKKVLLSSINFLIQESQLQKDFNQIRKLAHTYQNIAELYLKLFQFEDAIQYYTNVIQIAKNHDYYDLLAYSYQQIAECFEGLDDYNSSTEIIAEGIEYYTELYNRFEKKNDNLALSQMAQILKNFYDINNDNEQFEKYSKREAGAYINYAESLEKHEENYPKIARYYRGAALCYQELSKTLIECASCFVLAGNYSEKIEDFNNAAMNFIDAGEVFKELNNLDMAYKNFIKAGDDLWKFGDVNMSTECFLNAYDIAVEGGFEFNRFGIFNQIVRGLNKIAEDGLKNQEFFTAATLILESIKFYEKLEIADDLILREMVRNVYKYYHRAANLKKIGYSHLVNSNFLAALSSLLIGAIDKAKQIMSEIESKEHTVSNYKKIINLIIKWLSEGKEVRWEDFPYTFKRLMSGSEDITFIIKLFRNNMLINAISKKTPEI